MDILRARKKAAERKQAHKKETPTESPVAQPIQEEPTFPVETASPAAVTVPGPSSPTIETPTIEKPTAIILHEDQPEQAKMQEIELLVFRLGEEAYAVLVENVLEVLKIRDVTLMPNAPAHIVGVTSLRGTVLPVIDLCKRLGITSGVRDEKSRIIVVSSGEEEVGLIVDRVIGVVKVMPDEIKPTPENIEQGAEFLRGIVRKKDTLYILLDLEAAVEM